MRFRIRPLPQTPGCLCLGVILPERKRRFKPGIHPAKYSHQYLLGRLEAYGLSFASEELFLLKSFRVLDPFGPISPNQNKTVNRDLTLTIALRGQITSICDGHRALL
jgi:hypothetical protein